MSDDLDRDIRDGEKVEQFLKHEAVLRAFARVEQKYIDAWRKAETRDTREQYHARLTAVDDVKTQLHATIGNGQVAARQKEQNQKRELATARRGQ